MQQAQINQRLNALPAKPGVYLMKDDYGHVIYVGKAINLRSRVRSYFHAPNDQAPKVRSLVEHIADLEFIVTGSELEALILECNLIKKHRPQYNVRLKDDKHYPYLKITLQENFPHILIVRRMQDDGARYFGPYTSSKAVRQTLEMLRKLFPYLTCKREITGKDKRPCLYYHIGRCVGPCIGAISREEYRALIQQVVLFLEGKQERIVSDLQHKMGQAAESLQFERAGALRDQIQALEQVIERQRIVSASRTDQDVIAFAREDGQVCVQAFFIRSGKLIGREYFVLTGTQGEDNQQVMTSFVKQFYDEAAYIPSDILVQYGVDEAMVIEEWLRQKRGTKVAIHVPHRGKGQALVRLVADNAVETLTHLRSQWQADEARQVKALDDLQGYLHLERAPARIECYDISNIQGQWATGSMVVFAKGVARKSDYRRFRIKSVEGADDCAMLQEVLKRRFKRARLCEAEGPPVLRALREEPSGEKDVWRVLPDLLIVDGGKGQLRAATEALAALDLWQNVPTISIAKQREEVFVPGRFDPILLPRDSEGLYLLQRIRDEAHRFAIGYHRRLRDKAGLKSRLDDVPGIGPRRRQALLKHFGSLEAIRAASVDELSTVARMTKTAAEALKERL